ncbi:MAG TPA: hypothetical protein VI911_04290 [Patescibacteria group bacterium]|nr:hypothetical protein [Patescibacteria group bacterium]
MTAKKPRKRIEPRVKPREFTPGARQQRARDIARALWWDSMSRQVSCTLEATIGVVGGEVTFWTGEWVKASDGRVTEEKVMVACPWVGPPLTRKEWDEWEGVPGFTAWWLSAFPTAQGLTKLDLIRLDGAFWREVSRLVESGDPAGLNLYSRMHGLQGDPAADAAEIARHLKVAQASAWMTPTAEA